MNTCQICGRKIKAKNGMIAHHGYTRPDVGWQTVSCMGARHFPYEVSSDVLPEAIKSIETLIVKCEAKLKEITIVPPAAFEYRRGYDTGKVSKPENFDPNNPSNSFHHTFQYDIEFKKFKYGLEKQIKACKQTLEYLKQRLANWKPVL